jgi:hypothetical protein
MSKPEVTDAQVAELYITYVRALDTLTSHQMMVEKGYAVVGGQETLESDRRAVDKAHQHYFEAEMSFILAQVRQS